MKTRIKMTNASDKDMNIKTANGWLKASVLALAVGGLFLVSGCGSSVGEPDTKLQNKEAAAKHVLGIYKQVFDDPKGQEFENARNDLNRPMGVDPGNFYFFFSILPEGKIISWAYNDRLQKITPYGNLMENKPGSYTIEQQGNVWKLDWDGSSFTICDNGLISSTGGRTTKYLKESSKQVATVDDVFIYHGQEPIKLNH